MKNVQPASARMATLICEALICAAVICAAMICAATSAALAQSATTPSTDPSQAQPTQAQPTQAQPSQAQPVQSGAPANPATQSPKLAAGTVIPVELTKTIDAKKAKTGDEALAKVSQDLKTNSGEIVVPKDTKVIGHVTEVQARTKEQKESQVGIAFDHAVSKSGEMNLPMSIQAIIAPPSNNSGTGGGGYSSPGPATGGATATSPMGSRNSPMEGPPPQPSPSAVPTGGDNAKRPPINGNTQGVIGMPDLTLATSSQNASQGSVVSSEKSNVKLESGTMMLLRVNQ